MKLEYIVVYENSSDEFYIEHPLIKVKVTVGLQKFSPFTRIKTVRTITQHWYKLGSLYYAGIHVHLILIYKTYEYRHA